MSGQKRTRDGCWTCRERKKKCLRSQEGSCANCRRLNLECKTGVRLVWEDDARRTAMKRRGHLRKDVQLEWADAREESSTRRTSIQQLPRWMREDDQAGCDGATVLKLDCVPQSVLEGWPLRWRQPSVYPRQMDSLDFLLLENYIQRFSRTFPTQSGPSNPFLSVFVPLAMGSTTVLDSLLCLSSAQQWGGAAPALKLRSLNLRQQALRGCMSHVVLCQRECTKAVPVAEWLPYLVVLASSALLLLHEKLMGELNWRPHIEFMNSFFAASSASQRTLLSKSEADTLRFLHSILFYNDLVQSTTSRAPMMSKYFINRPYVTSEAAIGGGYQARQSSHSYYFPSLMARITAGDLSVTESDILRWDGSLQWLPSFSLLGDEGGSPGDAETSSKAGSVAISNLYRLAARVYQRQKSAHHAFAAGHSAEICSTEEFASQAVSQLFLLPEGSPYENALLWPLAIIAQALSADQQLQRLTILQRLQSLETRFGMPQFQRAQEVIISHWSKRDSCAMLNGDSGECFSSILLG